MINIYNCFNRPRVAIILGRVCLKLYYDAKNGCFYADSRIAREIFALRRVIFSKGNVEYGQRS